MHVEQLQRFQKLRNPGRAGEAEPAEECVGPGVGAGNRRGMAEVRRPPALRAAGLHDYHRHLPCARLSRQGFEPPHRIEPFDVQPERAHPVVVEQGARDAREPELRLIAGGRDVGDGQPAPLHGHADREVRRLAHDGDAALVRFEPPPAVLIRPQRNAVEEIEEAVAVRAENRHLAGRLDQGLLQGRAVVRFTKARGVADRAAGAGPRQRRDRLHRRVPVDADERGIGRPRQVGHGPEHRTPGDAVPLRVHRPERAVEAHPIALLGDPGRGQPADDGDAARPEETGDPGRGWRIGTGHQPFPPGRNTISKSPRPDAPEVEISPESHREPISRSAGRNGRLNIMRVAPADFRAGAGLSERPRIGILDVSHLAEVEA